MIVATSSLERRFQIAKEGPMTTNPGASVEVRALAAARRRAAHLRTQTPCHRPHDAELPEHYFRHDTASGIHPVAKISVHSPSSFVRCGTSALLRAIETWTHAGVPDEPGAWLYRVAHHYVIDTIRAQDVIRRQTLKTEKERRSSGCGWSLQELQDDLLRMLFLCADPEIPYDSQLALALKTLCGFSTEEIALRLSSTGNPQAPAACARAAASTWHGLDVPRCPTRTARSEHSPDALFALQRGIQLRESR